MRVVHVDLGKEMRGGQFQVLALMRGLRNRGVEQFLISPPGSPLAQQAAQDNFACEPLSSLNSGRRYGPPLLLDGTAIVHAHDAKAHTSCWLRGLANVFVSRRVAFPIQTNWFSRRKYRFAARYLAVSQYVRERLIDGGVEPYRIKVVYDGVDPLPPARAFKIVTPAFADRNKRTDLALEAAALAHTEVHVSHNLVADLADARAFVYLSESEGLGSAILLAQSAGVPVIASDTGGIPEIIRHGETGILVENTAASVAAALLALQDTARADALGRAGRDQVLARFTTAHMVEATLAAYTEVARV